MSSPARGAEPAVLLLPHDGRWKAGFEREAALVRQAFGNGLAALHHIGSTAVPGLIAKPVIDMLGVVGDLAAADHAAARMQALGYAAKGENGIAGRRYFQRRDASGAHSHHLHVFAAGSPYIERHLAFRDYLIAHPDAARAYAACKAELARTVPSRPAYQEGKGPFIVGMGARALVWYRQR